MNAKRILLVGGGTGGHIFPLVAVAQKLQQLAQVQGIELELRMMGDGDLLAQSAQELGIASHQIASPKWRRYFSINNFLDIFKIPLGIFQSLYFIWMFMPDVVFSKGGYASLLPVLVARLYFIPVFIHESDAIPGRTNRFLARRAGLLFLAFQEAVQYFPKIQTQVVGNPMRQEILSLQDADKQSALTAFGFTSDVPTLFITGGSQGAQAINDIIVQSVVELTKDFQVIHQCGSKNFDAIDKTIKEFIKEGADTYGKTITDRYRLFALLNATELSHALTVADVVVSRAGSGVFEIAAAGKPLILIPLLGAASDHQEANADIWHGVGVIVVGQDNLTPHILMNEIREAYKNRETQKQLLKAFVRTDAADVIAQALLI